MSLIGFFGDLFPKYDLSQDHDSFVFFLSGSLHIQAGFSDETMMNYSIAAA